MYHFKSIVLMSLLFVMGIGVTFSALADSLTDDNGTYFKGPMATCLSKAKVVYPCVSLSPPAYQSNSTFVTSLPIGFDLPLDSEEHENSWLAKLKDGEFWLPSRLFSKGAQKMDMNFGWDQSGAGMNMNLGPMKLNMYVDEGSFSESRIILGIDRTW